MKINRRKMFSYIAVLGLMTCMFGNSTFVANEKADIVKLVEQAANDEDLIMNSWSVYARETAAALESVQEFKERAAELKKRFPMYSWKLENDAHGPKAAGTYYNAEMKTTETINLIAAEDEGHLQSYLQYGINGSSWNRETALLFGASFEKKLNDIFREKPLIFSCIQGSISDNIDTVSDTETARLLALFNVNEIESTKEPHFVSISGRSDLFGQYLTKKQMNLQLALRTEGLDGKTTFTVGTPIITFEY